MLQNAYLGYLLAKIGADTAENERNFAKNFDKMSPTRPRTQESPTRARTGAGRLHKGVPRGSDIS